MHWRNSPFERTANARSRETSRRRDIYFPKLYTHRESASSRRVAAMSLTWNRRKRKSFKRKASHARARHTHTHAHAHVSSIGFRTSFRNETEKLSARKEFNRISLDCSFFLLYRTHHTFPLKPEKFTSLNRRQNSSRQLRHLNPLSQIASRNFFFPASYSPIATGMSLNVAEKAPREIVRMAWQTFAKSTLSADRRRYPKLF